MSAWDLEKKQETEKLVAVAYVTQTCSWLAKVVILRVRECLGRRIVDGKSKVTATEVEDKMMKDQISLMPG